MWPTLRVDLILGYVNTEFLEGIITLFIGEKLCGLKLFNSKDFQFNILSVDHPTTCLYPPSSNLVYPFDNISMDN